MATRVPTVGWEDLLAAARPAPYPLDSFRPVACIALFGAVLEASVATVLGDITTEAAQEQLGPHDAWFAEPYRWISSHFVHLGSGGLTVGHSGGQVWGPLMAAGAIIILLLSASLTRGWTFGRPIGTALMAVGTVGAGLSALPIVFTAAVGIVALVGYVAWSIIAAIIFVVLAIIFAIVAIVMVVMFIGLIASLNR
jgi:hypothetical protein